MSAESCAFCAVEPERVFHQGRLVLGIWDGFPVSPGHALLIPKRHVSGWFDATSQEQLELTEAIAAAKTAIERAHKPDAFNIGVNVGKAAGQTVFHLHVHIIPRYEGDVPDPRGGVRQLFIEKANYLNTTAAARPLSSAPHARALIAGGEEDPLLPHLKTELESASRVDIAVAFVYANGVAEIEEHLRDILNRGGRIRILTGDYLDATEPDALRRLLDLQRDIDIRVFETRIAGADYDLTGFASSFHPKAYVFHRTDGRGVAFVGSSNLSRMALSQGVEWNYRIISSRDDSGFQDIVKGFETLFYHPSTRPLDQNWIDAYASRRLPQSLLAGFDVVTTPEAVPSEPSPDPHEIQKEALAALEKTRADGNTAGLVVLATGLGKTWLSAFDSNRSQYRRVLFVAHREEILDQALKTFRRIRPSARLGRFTGTAKEADSDVLFASIQTLGSRRRLDDFRPDEFDYIVVDEFHHAAAATYRRLIQHFRPRFLLGLTATPERTDGGDLLALCQENLVYRCDVADGIRRGLLSPFRYFGVPDEVDYANIPWRASRFDEEALTQAVATQARAQNALEQYRSRAGLRTLAFCVSQRHADFMADFFAKNAVRAVAVHSGDTSAPRAPSLERLESGGLDVVCAVDMFNEGVDLPELDTVMMLRPTESRILWLQQFGRGLRKAAGKEQLTVIDYIGNHRTFLLKPQTLLQLGTGDHEVRYALDRLQRGEFQLPPGCEVTYDLEAVDILKALLRDGREDALKRWYEDFKTLHGTRPLAIEAFHEGYAPRAARKSHGSWLRFVDSMGDLPADQRSALEKSGPFLDALEATDMTKSYKMVLLVSMLNADRFPGAIAIEELTKGFREIAGRSAALKNDVGVDLRDEGALRRLIEKNPIEAWAGGKGTGQISYFQYEGGVFRTTIPGSSATREALQQLTREIAEWRLAEYLRRPGPAAGGERRFECKVSHSNGRPILFLDRALHSDLPEGWTPVTIDGNRYEANFVKVAVNVIRQPEKEGNELPNILRSWFGADAGLPGTDQRVAFEQRDSDLVLAPVGRRDGTLQLWRSYSREEIPRMFGLTFSPSIWQQGFIFQGGHIILLVTLDKDEHVDRFKYRDQFLSPDLFQWQSQNRTAQNGKHGQAIRDHEKLGIPVHLFVRSKTKGSHGGASPFLYSGRLRFQNWQGEKPITVQWRLDSPLPVELRTRLGVHA